MAMYEGKPRDLKYTLKIKLLLISGGCGLWWLRDADPRKQGPGDLYRLLRRDDGDVRRQQHLQGDRQVRQLRQRASGGSDL